MVKIGYSDHSIGSQACLAAVAKGAKIIEKHVMLDRKRKSIGITYANKFDFEGEFQDIAVSKLGFDDTLEVTYVIDSYPAAEAGFRTGDVLLSVNNKDIPDGKDASKKFSKFIVFILFIRDVVIWIFIYM